MMDHMTMVPLAGGVVVCVYVYFVMNKYHPKCFPARFLSSFGKCLLFPGQHNSVMGLSVVHYANDDVRARFHFIQSKKQKCLEGQ